LLEPFVAFFQGTNLYVSGIPKHWTDLELNEYFGQCGTIITSRILYNQEDGQSRCVAFIRYNQRYEAEAAVKKLNDSVPPDSQKPITVKLSNSLDLYEKRYQAQVNLIQTIQTPFNFYASPTDPIQLLRPSLFCSAPLKTYMFPPKQSLGPHMPYVSTLNSTTADTSGWCLFVYNLPLDFIDDNILWQLFCPFGAVQNTKLIKDQERRSKGFGFVTMTNYDEAVVAIQALNGYVLQDRILQVSFKTN
jgi:ELAV like protein 2/3/4